MEMNVHPFEKAGLGKAPFKFVGMETRVGPIKFIENGVEVQAGAPGQPMGTCEYCGMGIAVCCSIRSSDGKHFIVGSTCVEKTSKELTRAMKPELKKHKKAVAQERVAKAKAVFENEAGVQVELAKSPHSNVYMKARGLTAKDEAEWLFKYGGMAGQTRAARMTERVAKVVGVNV